MQFRKLEWVYQQFSLVRFFLASALSLRMPRGNRKRRRSPAPEMHRNNRYKESPPDFSLLASLYPSFSPYLIFPSSSDRPTIDFTDFSATRELTRVLLLHDHAVNWWIPDGQLCPTVPNRSNYIHWIGDLLSSNLIPPIGDSDSNSEKLVRGFDIGTGANCIYPLLGASLLGWSFVGSDVTEVALEWARKNVESNPHISHLIEVRDATKFQSLDGDEFASTSVSSHHVLVGVVKEGERFDFCMCNPPFFDNIEDAGLNPKTACGGTREEMVCPGGEQAFISRIIEDSVSLKHSFRYKLLSSFSKWKCHLTPPLQQFMLLSFVLKSVALYDFFFFWQRERAKRVPLIIFCAQFIICTLQNLRN